MVSEVDGSSKFYAVANVIGAKESDSYGGTTRDWNELEGRRLDDGISIVFSSRDASPNGERTSWRSRVGRLYKNVGPIFN